MIATLIFPSVAALLVYLAGRKDTARDPRLTSAAVLLMVLIPLLDSVLPKFGILPARAGVDLESGASWMDWAFRVWVAGLTVALMRLVIAGATLRKWSRSSVLIDRIGRIEVRMLSGLKGPVAAGVFRPVIYVPESWDSWSDRNRRIVMDHEISHHRRHDPLWRWVAGIACAVNWFNPHAWWICRRLVLQCEYACDHFVLCKGVPKAEYATLLCDLAQEFNSCGQTMAMAESASLDQRVRRLMGGRAQRGTSGIAPLMVLMLGSASLLGSIGPRTNVEKSIPAAESRIRWAANPFPGEVKDDP